MSTAAQISQYFFSLVQPFGFLLSRHSGNKLVKKSKIQGLIRPGKRVTIYFEIEAYPLKILEGIIEVKW
jgi:hypothetical protein